MLQLALFEDTPPIEYHEPAVLSQYYDVKTEGQWRDIGFKVAWDEKPKPFMLSIRGDKYYSFMQVDIIARVDTATYNRRLWWMDNWE